MQVQREGSHGAHPWGPDYVSVMTISVSVSDDKGASLVAQLVKNPPAMWDSIPGLDRSPLEQKGYPLQYSSLENSMDCMVHGVTKSRPHTTEQLSLSLCFLLGGGRDVTFLKVRAGNPLHILEV